MRILIATHNQAKLARYQKILAGVDDVELVSLTDLKITDKVDEDQPTNIKNAIKKAKFYGDLSGLITVGIDEALMTNFLPDNEQPGVYARRFSPGNRELTDDEVIDVWKRIFDKYPQPDKQFIWNFAIVAYNPKTKSTVDSCVEQISYVSKYFSDIMQKGYPMSSFMSPSPDGKPYTEVSQPERDEIDRKNFAQFTESFRQWLVEQS